MGLDLAVAQEQVEAGAVLLEPTTAQPVTARLAGAGSLRGELEALLAAAPDGASPDAYRTLLLRENVAGKRSAAARMWAWKRLKLRYALNPAIVEHVQQFKQRPIAWHLVSPERTFEAFVLYRRLNRTTLQRLRVQYAGFLVQRLREEQDRARQRGAAADVSRLQLQIEDVEEFRSRLERIERGDELRYRVRCRWKGDTEEGRPGPYAPDIDDGVKVNIRPFQEAGLLAIKEVIKKW